MNKIRHHRGLLIKPTLRNSMFTIIAITLFFVASILFISTYYIISSVRIPIAQISICTFIGSMIGFQQAIIGNIILATVYNIKHGRSKCLACLTIGILIVRFSIVWSLRPRTAEKHHKECL